MLGGHFVQQGSVWQLHDVILRNYKQQKQRPIIANPWAQKRDECFVADRWEQEESGGLPSPLGAGRALVSVESATGDFDLVYV